MGANNKIGWMYNWDSNLCGGAAHDHTGTWLEYMPMLHSDTPDHTGQWYVQNKALIIWQVLRMEKGRQRRPLRPVDW
jgi:hypothetical protein